jgi:antitoxin MazE
VTTQIVKWGNSQGVRIPKALLDILNISGNDTLDISTKDGTLIIKKVSDSKHKTIQERFADFNGSYEPVSIDWGEPQGDEIW